MGEALFPEGGWQGREQAQGLDGGGETTGEGTVGLFWEGDEWGGEWAALLGLVDGWMDGARVPPFRPTYLLLGEAHQPEPPALAQGRGGGGGPGCRRCCSCGGGGDY